MEKLTVFYNPDCSKCKKLRRLLSRQDIEVDWVNYLENPVSASDLQGILQKMDAQPSHIIRWTEEERRCKSEQELFQAIIDEPLLLNRPIVERANTAFLCRPLEIIAEKMPEYDWSEFI